MSTRTYVCHQCGSRLPVSVDGNIAYLGPCPSGCNTVNLRRYRHDLLDNLKGTAERYK